MSRLVLVPLLVAPVGGCPAVVRLCCTCAAVQQTDAAEPGVTDIFIKSAQNGCSMETRPVVDPGGIQWSHRPIYIYILHED